MKNCAKCTNERRFRNEYKVTTIIATIAISSLLFPMYQPSEGASSISYAKHDVLLINISLKK